MELEIEEGNFFLIINNSKKIIIQDLIKLQGHPMFQLHMELDCLRIFQIQMKIMMEKLLRL